MWRKPGDLINEKLPSPIETKEENHKIIDKL